VLRIRDVLFRIPDSRIFTSRIRIPDPGSYVNEKGVAKLSIFFFLLFIVSGVSFKSNTVSKREHNKDPEDNVRKFHQKMGPDPGSEKIHPGSGSWIQGVKKHPIPDPVSKHCLQVYTEKLQDVVLLFYGETVWTSFKEIFRFLFPFPSLSIYSPTRQDYHRV
jgi:hypothetical protein